MYIPFINTVYQEMFVACNFHGFRGWKSHSKNLIHDNLSPSILGVQTCLWDMEISMAGYPHPQNSICENLDFTASHEIYMPRKIPGIRYLLYGFIPAIWQFSEIIHTAIMQDRFAFQHLVLKLCTYNKGQIIILMYVRTSTRIKYVSTYVRT